MNNLLMMAISFAVGCQLLFNFCVTQELNKRLRMPPKDKEVLAISKDMEVVAGDLFGARLENGEPATVLLIRKKK